MPKIMTGLPLQETPWQRHVATWKDCTKCDLHKGRRHVVLARGSVPADVCFIGEAPGQSEDLLGAPFTGPAGIDPWCGLDYIISESLPQGTRYAITNLVCCIPLDESGNKVHEPPEDAIEACMPRLMEFFSICKPKIIICVGNVAEQRLTSRAWCRHCVIVGITHPAAILRQPMASRPLATKRSIARIREVVSEVLL